MNTSKTSKTPNLFQNTILDDIKVTKQGKLDMRFSKNKQFVDSLTSKLSNDDLISENTIKSEHTPSTNTNILNTLQNSGVMKEIEKLNLADISLETKDTNKKEPNKYPKGQYAKLTKKGEIDKRTVEGKEYFKKHSKEDVKKKVIKQ